MEVLKVQEKNGTEQKKTDGGQDKSARCCVEKKRSKIPSDFLIFLSLVLLEKKKKN